MLPAATPAWLADNVAQISLGTLLVLTFLVVRLVKKLMLRVILLTVIAAVGLFVYVNREPLQACARTCGCQIADRNIDVPTCNPDLDL